MTRRADLSRMGSRVTASFAADGSGSMVAIGLAFMGSTGPTVAKTTKHRTIRCRSNWQQAEVLVPRWRFGLHRVPRWRFGLLGTHRRLFFECFSTVFRKPLR